jgi:hypothetical protein
MFKSVNNNGPRSELCGIPDEESKIEIKTTN